MNSRTVLRQMLCLFISGMLSLGGLCFPTEARQGKPVIISFGQPNIWSLEQAHYLLARLHSQSLGLQSKRFGADDLDPNDVNGTRLQMLKSLLGVGVGFNQAAGFQNQQATSESNFNQDRRHQLLALRDQRQAELGAVGDQLATLRIDRARLNADPSATDAAKALKDAEIDQQSARQTRITNEISGLNTEITGITPPATTLATPSPPSATASPLPDSIADKLLADADFKKNQLDSIPRLNAETKLDNYLNLQYEIIAKQLTLLRDEVGPGRRLVFLELPQSFYTVPDKANRKMAQVWWRVASYSMPTDDAGKNPPCRDDEEGDKITPNADALGYRLKCNPYGNDKPREEGEIVKGIIRDRIKRAEALEAEKKREQENALLVARRQPTPAPTPTPEFEWADDDDAKAVRTVDLIPRQSALNVNEIQDKQKNFNIMGLFTWLSGIGVSLDFQRERRLYEQFLQQDVYASAFGKGKRDFGWTFGPRPGTERIAPGLQNTYAVLTVPEKAQAITLKARGCYFPRAAYAPNNFDDTLETGGGGGENPTLASQSGSLQCTADTDETTFNVVIPSTTENNFWVTGLQYRPVKPGARATVYIQGDYFSPQIGVLVNGVALRHSVGLAQPELAVAAEQNGFSPTPVGDLEFVNTKLLILSFTIADFKGTPTIALVTPGRARIINNLRLVINDSYKCSEVNLPNCPQAKTYLDPPVAGDPGTPAVDAEGSPVPVPYKKIPADPMVPKERSIWVRLDDQPAMFSESSPAPVLSVDSLKVFGLSPGKTTFKAQLLGSKFSPKDELRVNGVPVAMACTNAAGAPTDCASKSVASASCDVNGTAVQCPNLVAPGLLEFEFPVTNDANLDVTVIHKDKNPDHSTFSSKSFQNPLALSVTKTTILAFDPKHRPPLLRLQLEGSGFNPRIQASVEGKVKNVGRKSIKVRVANILKQQNSATTMVLDLELLSDDEFIVVELLDPQTHISVPVVINRPAPPDEQTKQGGGAGSNK
jgi:hypothetical protein